MFFVTGMCKAIERPKEVRVGALLGLILDTGEVSKTGTRSLASILTAISDINNKTDGIHDDILPNTTVLVRHLVYVGLHAYSIYLLL
jgi:hypothetical protein